MLKLKKRNYKLLGIKEHSIQIWKDQLRDDVKIFTHATKGKRFTEILINLNIVEMIILKIEIIMYNLTHKNNLQLIKRRS